MFSGNYFELLKQLLKSWQVIAVTVALIFYMYIVAYVSRSYHRKRVKKVRIKVKKKKAEPVKVEDDLDDEISDRNFNDELGLDEEWGITNVISCW